LPHYRGRDSRPVVCQGRESSLLPLAMTSTTSPYTEPTERRRMEFSGAMPRAR
jgi:hypothetical protein